MRLSSMHRPALSVRSSTRRVAGLAGLLAVVLFGPAAASRLDGAEPVLLRYGWKSGERYVYRIEIEADRGDEIEFQTGTPGFSVRTAGADGTTLATGNVGLSTRREAKPGRVRGIRLPGPPPLLGPGVFSGHEATLDARGRVLNQRGQAQLPWMLGNFAQLVFEPLPEKAEDAWKRTETMTIGIQQRGRFPRGPFRQAAESERMNAEEETAFSVQEVTAEEVTLKRDYSLKTIETVNGKPRIEMTGSGTWTFDRRRGVPSRLDYEFTLTQRQDNVTGEFPVKVACRLLTADEIAELDQQRTADQAARVAPPDQAQRDKLLADLKSGDKVRVRLACAALQPKQTAEPDDEISAALADLLGSDDQFFRQAVAAALENWATNKSADRLLEAAADTHWPVRSAVFKALGRLRDERAVEPLARGLEDHTTRLAAAQALQALGPAAEEAVLQVLEHGEWVVRSEACKILREIGTAKSLERLDQAAESDSGLLVRATARQAADAIRQRARAAGAR